MLCQDTSLYSMVMHKPMRVRTALRLTVSKLAMHITIQTVLYAICAIIGLVVVCVLSGLAAYVAKSSYLATGPWFFNHPFSPRTDPIHFAPYDKAYTNYTILLNPHAHSLRSDGIMTVDELIRWHIAWGYNAFVMTDHNIMPSKIDTPSLSSMVCGGIEEARYLAATKYNNNIVVIPGVEWTTGAFHLNVIGVEHPPRDIATGIASSVSHMTAKVKVLNGVTMMNHRVWSTSVGMPYWQIENIAVANVDYIEGVTPEGVDLQAVLWARSTHKIGVLTSVDVHSPREIPNCWTVLNTDTLSEAAIMTDLHARRTSFIYAPVGVPVVQVIGGESLERFKLLFGPWIGIGNALFSTYWKMAATINAVHWGAVMIGICWFIFLFLFTVGIIFTVQYGTHVLYTKFVVPHPKRNVP